MRNAITEHLQTDHIETELAPGEYLAVPEMRLHFDLLFEACVFSQQVSRAYLFHSDK